VSATAELKRVEERIDELNHEAERVGLSTEGKLKLNGYEKHRTALQNDIRRQQAEAARKRAETIEASVAKLRECFDLLQMFNAARTELDTLRSQANAAEATAVRLAAAEGLSLKALETQFYLSAEWRQLRDQVMRFTNSAIL
jgi:chromosome segregation ATPase